VLPGQLIAFADALQGDQAWVRGGICHHDYACSLDDAVLPPEKHCYKFGSCLACVTDWFYFLFLKYCLNTNRVPAASPAMDIERFHPLKRFPPGASRPLKIHPTSLKEPVGAGF